MADQVSGRPQYHGVRIEVLQCVFEFESPGEDNRKGHFVQLDAIPVGFAIDPEVLRETSVLLLGNI